MSALPGAAWLDDPPGRPDHLADSAADVRAAARSLHLLAGAAGAARVPSWRGGDARALADRIASVSRLAGDGAEALARGAERLSQHAELWSAVGERMAALRVEQEEDRAAAGRRVAVPFDALDPLALPVADVLAALGHAEDRRAAEHRRLLTLLEDDAADTARTLRSCCAVVGAVGGPGRAGREVAHLATVLPAWGALELVERGRDLAETLVAGDRALSEEAAEDALALAADGTFASALLARLGVEGLRQLLLDLDHVVWGEGSAVARVLGASLGAAAALPPADERITEVLTARYVDPTDSSTSLPDQVARGLAIVVLTGVRYGQPPASRTMADWARQVARREVALGPVADRLGFLADDAADADPLQGLVGAIGSRGDGTAAAHLLADRQIWTDLLARPWPDDGDALAGLVASLVDAPEEPARTALRSGLEALGRGLEDGHPDGWTVDAELAAAVRPRLGDAVAAHLDAITGLLGEVSGRCPDVDELAALHGLGFLTIDEHADEAVARALRAWGERTPPRALTTEGQAVLVAVPSAFLAVRDYGQRLVFALGTHEKRLEAARAKRRWDRSVGLLVEIAVTAVGNRLPAVEPLLGALETVAQSWAGADGRWDDAEDDGPRLTGADAAARGAGPAGTHRDESLREVARAAAEIFTRTRSVLGEPVIATPEEGSLAQDLLEGVLEDTAVPEPVRRGIATVVPGRGTAGPTGR